MTIIKNIAVAGIAASSLFSTACENKDIVEPIVIDKVENKNEMESFFKVSDAFEVPQFKTLTKEDIKPAYIDENGMVKEYTEISDNTRLPRLNYFQASNKLTELINKNAYITSFGFHSGASLYDNDKILRNYPDYMGIGGWIDGRSQGNLAWFSGSRDGFNTQTYTGGNGSWEKDTGRSRILIQSDNGFIVEDKFIQLVRFEVTEYPGIALRTSQKGYAGEFPESEHPKLVCVGSNPCSSSDTKSNIGDSKLLSKFNGPNNTGAPLTQTFYMLHVLPKPSLSNPMNNSDREKVLALNNGGSLGRAKTPIPTISFRTNLYPNGRTENNYNPSND